jgi:hypothetical protein
MPSLPASIAPVADRASKTVSPPLSCACGSDSRGLLRLVNDVAVSLAASSVASGRDFLAAVPAIPLLRVWLLVIVAFMASFGSLEAFWRNQGCRPSAQDSKDLWRFWRRSVYCSNGRVLVFLGTSRIMADVSLDSAHDVLPDYRLVQLGLSGAESCIGFLRAYPRTFAVRRATMANWRCRKPR